MKRRLEYAAGTSAKFWEVEVVGSTVTTRWGRIGTRGQSRRNDYPDAVAARRATQAAVASKLRKGYRATASSPSETDEHSVHASTTAVSQEGAEARGAEDTSDQFELFAQHRPSLLRRPDFGELRLLSRGRAAAAAQMLRGHPLLPPIEWLAEEADGGAVGRLALRGVPRPLRPVIYASNEGGFHLSGFSLVDHLGGSLLDFNGWRARTPTALLP